MIKQILCFIIFMVMFSSFLSANESNKEVIFVKYDSLFQQYQQEHISEIDYLKTIDTTTERLLFTGVKFTTEELLNLLKNYKVVASKKQPQYVSYLADYFRFLMNNAFISGRSGEALFYAEKNEKLVADHDKETFVIPYFKLIVWAKSGNNPKVEDVYRDYRPYLKSLLQKEINFDNIVAYFNVAQFYFYSMKPLLLVKSEYTEEILKDGIVIYEKINQFVINNKAKRANPAMPKLQSLFSHIEYYNYNKDLNKAKALIDSALSIFEQSNLNENPNFSTAYSLINSFLLDYYMHLKDVNKAEYYIDILENRHQIFDDEQSKLFIKKAELHKIKGDYEQAYLYMDSAIDSKSQELVTAYQEMNQLWYSHSEAEYNREELKEQQEIRKRQNLWIFGITTLSILLLSGAIYFLRKEKRQSKKLIAQINKTTEVEIEDAKYSVMKDEQKKLGQDLHDNYSGSLISILHNIEFISKKELSDDLKNDIDNLKSRVNDVYNAIRSKSHFIYNNTSDDHSSFQQSIERIIDVLVNRKSFETEVDIDSKTAANLSLEQRIELLRILQEATSNILKHSKATQMSIFLYSVKNEVVFQISDNGLGFNHQVKDIKGIGLQSIANRTKKINGHLEIVNDNGTSLIITFPEA